MPYDPALANRIDKLIGMLTSDFDGERANASAMLARMAKEAKMTMPEFLQAHAARGGPPPGNTGGRHSYAPPPPADDLECLRYGLAHPTVLTVWEQDFATSILEHHRSSLTLSEKQQAVLDRIKKRVEPIMKRSGY